MADLSVVVSGRLYGRSPLGIPPNVLAFALTSERLHISELLTVGITGTPLTATLSETLKVFADYVSRIWNESGDVAFTASPDHALVTFYQARLRVYGNATIVATAYLGKGTPDPNNVIIHPLNAWFANRAAGTYTVSVAATDDGVTFADSGESNPFTIPLPWPAERLAISDTVTAQRV